jgi:hypothetical protein
MTHAIFDPDHTNNLPLMNKKPSKLVGNHINSNSNNVIFASKLV